MLQLYGIVLSATIALSSTTLVGNAMAGIMLRTLRNFSPGDYVHVGDYFGRISEMDLLHTEIQTEERDLTTLLEPVHGHPPGAGPAQLRHDSVGARLAGLRRAARARSSKLLRGAADRLRTSRVRSCRFATWATTP